jgi:hypothetical protein
MVGIGIEEIERVKWKGWKGGKESSGCKDWEKVKRTVGF